MQNSKGFVECFICNKSHLTVMCPQEHTEESESRRKSNESSSKTENLSKQNGLTLLQITAIRVVNGNKVHLARVLLD